MRARSDGDAVQVDEAGAVFRVAVLRGLVPEVRLRVGEPLRQPDVVGAQGVVGRRTVAVHDGDGPLVVLLREVVEHRHHGGAADARRREQQGRFQVVEHQVPVGDGDAQQVAHAGVLVQVAGDLAVGRALPAYALHGDRPEPGGGSAHDAVLAYLAGPVREFHLYGDVLAGPEGGRRRVVGGAQHEGGHVLGLLDPGGHLPGVPHVARRHSPPGVQPGLDGDEGVGHQPVDLVPRLGDLGGHGVAQDVGDGGEEVGVHHLVLVRGDPEGRVLVGDALQHHVRPGVRVLDQCRGERGDRAGQGPALVAGRLVAPVEQVPQELGVGGEQLLVEEVRDVPDGRADGGEGGADGGGGPVGEHEGGSSGVRVLPDR